MDKGPSFLFAGIHFNRKKFSSDFARFQVLILFLVFLFGTRENYRFKMYFSNCTWIVVQEKKESDKLTEDWSFIEDRRPEEEEKEVEDEKRVRVKKRKRKAPSSGKLLIFPLFY